MKKQNFGGKFSYEKQIKILHTPLIKEGKLSSYLHHVTVVNIHLL
jgi:hypothetical protein